MGDTHGNNTINFGEKPEVLPPPQHPMAAARKLLPEFQTDTEAMTLLRWRGGWYGWKSTHWHELEDSEIRSKLYKRVEKAKYVDEKGNLKDWAPTRNKIADLFDAFAALVHLPESVEAPAWMDGAVDEPVGPVVACTNGLLDIHTGKLLEHNPHYLNLVSVPFDYDAAVPEPKAWLNFLSTLWPDDEKSIMALQEWFGYILSGRTDMQKMFLMIGPPRSGKGTIARLLETLIGKPYCAAPTLSSFSGDFGMQPLIGKPLAVIGDARLPGRNTHVVVERLLSISGEDTMTINRKYREHWTGKLPTRMMIVSNELPNFGDASGTIAHRFIAVSTTRSWLGKEDHQLENTLSAELTGIMNWALAGLARLDHNKKFTVPVAMNELILDMKDTASPMSAFVRECCELGPQMEIEAEILYGAWKDWCFKNGHRHGTTQQFGRNLRAVVPQIRVVRPREGESKKDRKRKYIGIGVGSTIERDADHADQRTH